jgi:hypothetical protein
MKTTVKTSPPRAGYVVAWVEADVVEIDVQEGPDVYRRQACRVFGMNAMASADRTQARAAALTNGQPLQLIFLELPPSFLIPSRFKKYGRTVVRLLLPDGRDVAEVLIAEGYAVPYYMGLGKPASVVLPP